MFTLLMRLLVLLHFPLPVQQVMCGVMNAREDGGFPLLDASTGQLDSVSASERIPGVVKLHSIL